jgi:hypothetical protein
MPPGTTWKCRFNHVIVTSTLLVRDVRCSSDEWRTQAGDTVNVFANDAPASANVSLFEAGQYVGAVELLPCVKGISCLPRDAPELP